METLTDNSGNGARIDTRTALGSSEDWNGGDALRSIEKKLKDMQVFLGETTTERLVRLSQSDRVRQFVEFSDGDISWRRANSLALQSIVQLNA